MPKAAQLSVNDQIKQLNAAREGIIKTELQTIIDELASLEHRAAALVGMTGPMSGIGQAAFQTQLGLRNNRLLLAGVGAKHH